MNGRQRLRRRRLAQQRQLYLETADTYLMEVAEDRRDAVELAVRAPTPLAGAYRTVEEYGEQITRLAAHLGTYIRDGA